VLDPFLATVAACAHQPPGRGPPHARLGCRCIPSPWLCACVLLCRADPRNASHDAPDDSAGQSHTTMHGVALPYRHTKARCPVASVRPDATPSLTRSSRGAARAAARSVAVRADVQCDACCLVRCSAAEPNHTASFTGDALAAAARLSLHRTNGVWSIARQLTSNGELQRSLRWSYGARPPPLNQGGQCSAIEVLCLGRGAQAAMHRTTN